MKERHIPHDHNQDGLDRRGLLECMAWAGTGMLWTVSSGLLGSTLLTSLAGAAEMMKGIFSFAQISDSHICITDYISSLKHDVRLVRESRGTPPMVDVYGCVYDIDREALSLVVEDKAKSSTRGRQATMTMGA